MTPPCSLSISQSENCLQSDQYPVTLPLSPGFLKCFAKQGFCDNLERWDGDEGGRNVREGGDMSVPMADSC